MKRLLGSPAERRKLAAAEVREDAERFGDKRRTFIEEAERITDLPTLAELPVDPESVDGRHKVPALAHTESAVAEAVRSLRVSIGFCALDTPLRRLVVTSPQPQDGKSFVDAVPNGAPADILKQYHASHPDSPEALKRFTDVHFSLPAQASSAPSAHPSLWADAVGLREGQIGSKEKIARP